MRYTSIDIIFNPNSTGPSKQYAEELYEQLSAEFTSTPIKLQNTTHAGHAETIAYKASMLTKRPLIVSSSGDGGYHEVINGVLAAQQAIESLGMLTIIVEPCKRAHCLKQLNATMRSRLTSLRSRALQMVRMLVDTLIRTLVLDLPQPLPSNSTKLILVKLRSS